MSQSNNNITHSERAAGDARRPTKTGCCKTRAGGRHRRLGELLLPRYLQASSFHGLTSNCVCSTEGERERERETMCFILDGVHDSIDIRFSSNIAKFRGKIKIVRASPPSKVELLTVKFPPRKRAFRRSGARTQTRTLERVLSRGISTRRPSPLIPTTPTYCCPGYCATDMTDHRGHLTAEYGSRTPFMLTQPAGIGSDPMATGKFFTHQAMAEW